MAPLYKYASVRTVITNKLLRIDELFDKTDAYSHLAVIFIWYLNVVDECAIYYFISFRGLKHISLRLTLVQSEKKPSNFQAGILNQPAHDENGQEIDPETLSYGTQSCLNLTRVSTDLTMGNSTSSGWLFIDVIAIGIDRIIPDIYHIFAMMIYLNDRNWASGVAQPFIQQAGDEEVKFNLTGGY